MSVEDYWPKSKLRIERIGNGFIVKFRDENGNKEKMAFEEMEDAPDELDATRSMLHFVLDYFGIYQSKHNARNLVIEVRNTSTDGE